jgi:hypothetical protein
VVSAPPIGVAPITSIFNNIIISFGQSQFNIFHFIFMTAININIPKHNKYFFKKIKLKKEKR